MVHGIAKFKEYFENYIGQYVFIGGTACDIVLETIGEDFRATKDLDIVLIIENLEEAFVDTFIRFVKAGGYSNIKKGTGENQFYRFEKPVKAEFPAMIELFSKKPSYIKSFETHLAPIHISDDVISLSAILLNDDYYTLLKDGKNIIEEVSVLGLEYIILFKIKAYLDLSDRKINGESIDGKNIKKHKKDIYKLVENIDVDSRVEISEKIKEDVINFIDKCEEDIKNQKERDIIKNLKRCFSVQ